MDKLIQSSWLAILLLLASCGSTNPSRFYVLTSVGADTSESTPPSESIHVRMAPINLPRYLSGLEIVTRREANQLELAEYDRWAEPLDGAFSRVLAANLAHMIPTNHIINAPWEAKSGNELVVHVTVARFDIEAGQAILEATWGISSSMLSIDELHRTRIVKPASQDNFSNMAQALSLALGDLSQQIATELRSAFDTESGSGRNLNP